MPGTPSAPDAAVASSDPSPPAGEATASVAERARSKWSNSHLRYIPLDQLGTSPYNRGRLGVSSFHVHEVVTSIKNDGLSQHRYRDATVVRVPDESLAMFRKFNEQMCAADDKLPPFSPEMRYALLSKNHFVTALKLFKVGTVPAIGTGEVIRPSPQDKQLRRHLDEGVTCEVMDEGLWREDMEAMLAIIAEDNMNAAVTMGIHEMEVLGWISQTLVDVRTSSPTDLSSAHEDILVKARRQFGQQTFDELDLTNLFNFAIRVPASLVKNLSELHFSLVSPALLRCRPADFGAIAAVDSKYPYVKVALIVATYLGSSSQGSSGAKRQVAGTAAICSSIKKATLDDLSTNQSKTSSSEKFMKTVLRHYPTPSENVIMKMLLQARARLFYRSGRMMQSWPESTFKVQHQFATIEGKYAADLTACGALVCATDPAYKMPEIVATTEKAGNKRKSTPSGSATALLEPAADDAIDADVEIMAPPQEGAGQGATAASTPGADGAGDFTAPETIACTDMRKMPAIGWDAFGDEMYTALGVHATMHAFLSQTHTSSADAIETFLLEAADPVVWQTRARTKFAVGTCTLFPFSRAGLAIVDPEKALKRPHALHPRLPFCVQVQVEVPALLESKAFVIKSPLAGKVPKDAPPPFWAVLETAFENSNMEVRDVTVTLPMPNTAIQMVTKKGRKKKCDVVVRFPVLVNRVALNAGDVLTYEGSLMDVTTGGEDVAVDVD